MLLLIVNVSSKEVYLSLGVSAKCLESGDEASIGLPIPPNFRLIPGKLGWRTGSRPKDAFQQQGFQTSFWTWTTPNAKEFQPLGSRKPPTSRRWPGVG